MDENPRTARAAKWLPTKSFRVALVASIGWLIFVLAQLALVASLVSESENIAWWRWVGVGLGLLLSIGYLITSIYLARLHRSRS